jgi:hypothetical protein
MNNHNNQTINLQNYKRTLLEDGRHLVHMHLETSEVFGNSTGLMYYYSNVYFGSHDNLSKQALILDTGSGITCFPCKGACKSCGRHINSYYDISKSSSIDFLD